LNIRKIKRVNNANYSQLILKKWRSVMIKSPNSEIIDMMPTRVEDHNETREGTSSDSGYTGIEKLTKCVSDHARH